MDVTFGASPHERQHVDDIDFDFKKQAAPLFQRYATAVDHNKAASRLGTIAGLCTFYTDKLPPVNILEDHALVYLIVAGRAGHTADALNAVRMFVEKAEELLTTPYKPALKPYFEHDVQTLADAFKMF